MTRLFLRPGLLLATLSACTEPTNQAALGYAPSHITNDLLRGPIQLG
jgi:hypothetical protein